LIFFGGLTPKNGLHTNRQSNKPTISSENEIEKCHFVTASRYRMMRDGWLSWISFVCSLLLGMRNSKNIKKSYIKILHCGMLHGYKLQGQCGLITEKLLKKCGRGGQKTKWSLHSLWLRILHKFDDHCYKSLRAKEMCQVEQFYHRVFVWSVFFDPV